MLSKTSIDILVAVSSLFSMIMNAVKSLKPNVSMVLLFYLAVQQIGNMGVSINLTSTRLDEYQKQLYIGASVLAFSLTTVQFLLMMYQKFNETTNTLLRFK